MKRLEVNLGPDTGDLGLRIGLHSGPVTAGKFPLHGYIETRNTRFDR